MWKSLSKRRKFKFILKIAWQKYFDMHLCLYVIVLFIKFISNYFIPKNTYSFFFQLIIFIFVFRSFCYINTISGPSSVCGLFKQKHQQKNWWMVKLYIQILFRLKSVRMCYLLWTCSQKINNFVTQKNKNTFETS